MNPLIKKYPDNLIGTYSFNFGELYLKPITLTYSNQDCHQLSAIAIREGNGLALFSDQNIEVFKMNYDEYANVYSFYYNMIEHSFEIKANIGGLCRLVEVRANYIPKIEMAMDLNS